METEGKRRRGRRSRRSTGQRGTWGTLFASGEQSLNGHSPGNHEAGLTCTNSSVLFSELHWDPSQRDVCLAFLGKYLNHCVPKLSENTGLFKFILHWGEGTACHTWICPTPLGLSCLPNRQLLGVACGIVNHQGWPACQPVWLEPWKCLTATPFTLSAESTMSSLIKRRVTPKHQKTGNQWPACDF